MPALGGVPTRLIGDVDSIISLSPDGSRMAFVRNSEEESALIIASADGSNQRKLATRQITDYFKVPAWSPDGKVIACSSGSGEPYDIHNSVIAVRVDDGTQSPLTPQKWAFTYAVQWLADGSGLLITARERHEAPDQVWHISCPGGAARRLTSDSKMYRSISLTADSQTILAVQTELFSDIWVASDLKAPKKVTFVTGSYEKACYAPDGRIVYASQASGNWDIWIMNSDGSNPKQLTVDAGVNLHQTVSPDGRYIIFASNRAGVFNIWRMDSDGGNPVRLTNGSGEKFPCLSPDGKWIVYNSVASDQNLYALWKVSIEGGEPLRLTDSNSEHPAISPDGSQIAYFYSSKGKYKIVVIPSAGGPPNRSIDIAQTLDPMTHVRWLPDGQSLTYAATRNDVCNIWMQSLAGGEPKQLTDFKVDGRFLFDWSRDGKQLVFTRRLWAADLVLLKNFAASF
jgi:TolB protein